jgi:hypothetical protein
MNLDEFRHGMATYRQAVDREAQALKNPFHALKLLRTLYEKFDVAERAMADQVIAEWALSDDENTRFDAQTLIEEFKIRSALPALKKLAMRLAASTAVGASNELELVNRQIADLTRGQNLKVRSPEARTMAGPVVFEKIDKVLPLSAGQFEAIFGAIYELYLNKDKASDIAADLRPMLSHYREYCWPDRYKNLPRCGYHGADVSRYPAQQRPELLRAAEHFLHDFERGRIEPRLYWNHEQPERFLSALREFVSLMRQEIAAKPTTEDYIDRFERTSRTNYTSLWDVVTAAKRINEDREEESVRSLTLGMVSKMLARGFRAGPRFNADGALELWPDQSAASVIGRIEANWNQLGYDPSRDYFVWFERPKAKWALDDAS